MQIKEPFKLCQQIEKLKSKGCCIDDENKAKQILNQINYYKLSAYFLPFKNPDGSYKFDTSLYKVYKIYEFDKKVSAFLYEVIQEVETFIKAQIAYEHANKHGATGYLNSDNFMDSQKANHNRLLSLLEDEISKNKKVPFVSHYLQKYNGTFPLWVAVELFSFGNISQFYSQMLSSDKKIIANVISKTTGITSNCNQISSCLKCLTHLRNICAHFSRIYYFQFTSVPNLSKDLIERAFANGIKYMYLYTYLFVIRSLYPNPSNWKNIITNLQTIIEKYNDYIDIKCIGFPDNWEEQLLFV